jgi:hypothetical protein
MNIMDMKIHMLICLFIFMLGRSEKEKKNEMVIRTEVSIRKGEIIIRGKGNY